MRIALSLRGSGRTCRGLRSPEEAARPTSRSKCEERRENSIQRPARHRCRGRHRRPGPRAGHAGHRAGGGRGDRQRDRHHQRQHPHSPHRLQHAPGRPAEGPEPSQPGLLQRVDDGDLPGADGLRRQRLPQRRHRRLDAVVDHLQRQHHFIDRHRLHHGQPQPARRALAVRRGLGRRPARHSTPARRKGQRRLRPGVPQRQASVGRLAVHQRDRRGRLRRTPCSHRQGAGHRRPHDPHHALHRLRQPRRRAGWHHPRHHRSGDQRHGPGGLQGRRAGGSTRSTWWP